MIRRPARPTRRPLAVVSSLCLVVALLGVAPSAWAAGSTSPVGPSAAATDVTSVRISPEDAAAAVALWTPERRAAAIDVDSGKPVSELEASKAAAPISTAQQVAPVGHIGRIFYDQDGATYACTANVVVSANRSTIATAGHCLTSHQVYSTNIVFYPAYEEHTSVYGAWPVVGFEVSTAWYTSNDRVHDTGFLAVGHDSSGRDITSVVGASPVLFDQSRSEQVTAYGYPAARRFDGEHLERCRGMSAPFLDTMYSVACDMNNGSSGGPLFAGDSADGPQIGVVCCRYVDETRVNGPMWNEEQHDVYDVVANTTY